MKVVLKKWFRLVFHRCADCGVRLPLKWSWCEASVCQKCFDDFNGLTVEEMMEL